MTVSNFLFELGCEELPSGMVKLLSEALATHVHDSLNSLQIAFTKIHRYATPRRLALLVEGIAAEQLTQKITKRGPALAAAYDTRREPTSALQGFLKSSAIKAEQLSIEATDKGSWVCYHTTKPGLKTVELLPEIFEKAVAKLPIAKSMRWGNGTISFARPVHWLVMLFDKDVVPARILGLVADRFTHGHRFHHPQAVALQVADEYPTTLEQLKVRVDFAKRRETIEQQVQDCATVQNAEAVMPEKLLEEVTAIVEWPHALTVSFDDTFLSVPHEVLIAAMQNHQKCFALQAKNGALVAKFVTIANIDSRDSARVIAGNAKVMRARLSDAAFFYEQDKKNSLINNLENTKTVIFQKKLGSLFDKTERVKSVITKVLQDPLQLPPTEVSRACDLSKCDLMTGMVGEFPELQGLMGYYYALHAKEHSAVAKAIEEQYLPRFAADKLPKSDLGLALSLVDRIDTLVGIFAIGEKPKGDKDPFKLRRNALAVVRLIIASKRAIDLNQLIAASAASYQTILPNANTIHKELHTFIIERLSAFYANQSIALDLVMAVKHKQSSDLLDFDLRIQALKRFSLLEDAVILAQISKRVSNILSKNKPTDGLINEALLTEPAEHKLFEQIERIENEQRRLLASKQYAQALSEITALNKPLDAFFTDVMVMVEDKALQTNRLTILGHLQNLLQSVADISELKFQ